MAILALYHTVIINKEENWSSFWGSPFIILLKNLFKFLSPGFDTPPDIDAELASKKPSGDRIPGDRMSTLSDSSPRGHHTVLISISADEPVGKREVRGGGTSTK